MPSGNGSIHVGRERVIDIQRARLISAVTGAVVELGLANATVAHIVARAGVSRRTFYELFEDREECFLTALDAAIARASELVLAAYDPDVGWRERMRAALIALLTFLQDNPGAGRILIVESLGAGPQALERRNRVLVLAIAAVDEGRGKAKADSGPPPMTAEGVVGGVLSVLHSRLSAADRGSLFELTGPLMGMIVLPYLGAAAARRELEHPPPIHSPRVSSSTPADPLRDLEMRLTYRTVRVLMSVAANPCSSNRTVGRAADVNDQGQISKLLTRLSKLGLIANTGAGQARGVSNAWMLTAKGREIEQALGVQAN